MTADGSRCWKRLSDTWTLHPISYYLLMKPCSSMMPVYLSYFQLCSNVLTQTCRFTLIKCAVLQTGMEMAGQAIKQERLGSKHRLNRLSWINSDLRNNLCRAATIREESMELWKIHIELQYIRIVLLSPFMIPDSSGCRHIYYNNMNKHFKSLSLWWLLVIFQYFTDMHITHICYSAMVNNVSFLNAHLCF